MNFDFGDVLNRAWQITWKYKVLWVYGFLYILISFLFLPVGIIPAVAPMTSGQSGDITNEPWFLLIFMGGLFVFILVLFPLSVVMNGALSIGTLRAEKGEERLPFMELIRESLPFFWRLLGLMLIFFCAMILIVLAFVAFQFVLTVVTFGLAILCATPLAFLLYPASFVWYVCMEQSMAAIIVDNMKVMEAMRQGWQIFRKNIAAVVIIGLVLYFGVSTVAGFAMMPMMLPFFAVPFALGVEEFNRGILLVAGICAAVYLPVFAAFQGAIISLMKSGWILTYLRLTRSPTGQPLVQEPAL